MFLGPYMTALERGPPSRRDIGQLCVKKRKREKLDGSQKQPELCFSSSINEKCISMPIVCVCEFGFCPHADICSYVCTYIFPSFCAACESINNMCACKSLDAYTRPLMQLYAGGCLHHRGESLRFHLLTSTGQWLCSKRGQRPR